MQVGLFTKLKMLFRGVIRDHCDFKCLQNIVHTLSRSGGKECALNIRSNEFNFIIREESRRYLPLIYAEIKQEAVFAEYLFRGVSEEQNEIVLLINPTFLAKAFSPVRVFDYIKLKLVKIQENSFLSIEILIISPISAEKKNVVHNIPVKVILPHKWDLYCLPEVLPNFNTIAELPNVRHIIDKYKNLSPTMTIFVNVATCALYLTIETDMTTVISNFFNLSVDHHRDGNALTDQVRASDDTLPNSEGQEAFCKVETKSLAQFINSVYYPVAQKCLFINRENCVKFRFTIKEDVSLYGIATHVSE